MKIALQTIEKESLERQHSSERDGRVRDRIKAVLLSSEGWTQIQISQALRIRPETVHEHLSDYTRLHKLKPENGGSRSEINEVQTSELIRHIEATTYLSAKEICFHVKTTYGVKFSLAGMTQWLHRHRFSYKKPKETPKKADPVKQLKFMEKYESLLNSAGDDPVLFMDSVHPTMATKVTYGWIRTGTEKLIASTASRTRMNVTGSLDLETMSVVAEDYETINGGSTVSFLKKIETHYPKALQINVILDQSSYHRSQEVQEFVKKSRIKLHFLPPYSPNLNPIERLWKVMNEIVRNNRVFQSAKEFREAIRSFFSKKWPAIAPAMVDRITDNFQIIKQASSS